MPAAIDFATLAAISPRNDGKIVIYSENFTEERTFDAAALAAEGRSQHWSDYPLGVIAILAGEGHRIPGFSLSLWGDVPLGSGLSSSAAVEVATALAVTSLLGRHLSRPGAGAALPAGGKRVCRRELRHHGSVHLRQWRRRSCAAAGLPRSEFQACADSGECGAGDCQHDGEALGGGRRIHQRRAEVEEAAAVIARHRPEVRFCAMRPWTIWRSRARR